MSKARILIVEDSFIVALHLQKTLENEECYSIATQSTGEGALQAIDEKQPDLILMDINLGGKTDGIETALFIKSRYNIPIIFITAFSDKATLDRAKITEPYGYLVKPFDDQSIIRTIDLALYKHEMLLKLLNSEERYFSILKSISDVVIIIDLHYQITYLNPSAEALIGGAFKEIAGQSFFEMLKFMDSDSGNYVNPIQCETRIGPNNLMLKNLLLVSKKEIEKPIGEGSMSLVIDEKGNLTGLLFIFKDISIQIEASKLKHDLEKKRVVDFVEGQEKERMRIAKDLHDGLGQMLNAIKMGIDFSVSKKANDTGKLSMMINEAIQETKRMAENLMPARLIDFDLGTCLNSLCNNLNNNPSGPGHPGRQIEVNFKLLGALPTLEQSQKVNLYRIAQEALTNALTHSKGSSITVQLSNDEGKIQVSIEDNGAGISRPDADSFLKQGIRNMKQRAEMMGGKLTIESDARRGTLIVVEAPLKTE